MGAMPSELRTGDCNFTSTAVSNEDGGLYWTNVELTVGALVNLELSNVVQ